MAPYRPFDTIGPSLWNAVCSSFRSKFLIQQSLFFFLCLSRNLFLLTWPCALAALYKCLKTQYNNSVVQQNSKNPGTGFVRSRLKQGLPPTGQSQFDSLYTVTHPSLILNGFWKGKRQWGGVVGRGRCRFWCVFNSRPIIKTDSHKIRTWLMQRLRGSYVINVNVIHNIIIYDARTYTRICIRRIVSSLCFYLWV